MEAGDIKPTAMGSVNYSTNKLKTATGHNSKWSSSLFTIFKTLKSVNTYRTMDNTIGKETYYWKINENKYWKQTVSS